MPEYWDVIYRAEADFDDLMAKAAEAEAALKAMAAAAADVGRQQTDAARQAGSAWDTEISKIKNLGDAMRTLQGNADLYNQRVLFAGRSSMEQHLADLSRETTEQILLNRARQRGLYSVQEDYMWRQRELQQAYLWNIAQQRGFASYDQYLNAMQKERIAWQDQNAVLAERVSLENAAANAALHHYRSMAGNNATFSQLSDTASQYNDALNALPDTVSTVAAFDDRMALYEVGGYNDLLNAIPDTEQTVAQFYADTAESDLAAYLAAMHDVPENVVSRAYLTYRVNTVGAPAQDIETKNMTIGARIPQDMLAGTDLAMLSRELAGIHDEGVSAAEGLSALAGAETDAGNRAMTMAASVAVARRALADEGGDGRGLTTKLSTGGIGFYGAAAHIPLFGGFLGAASVAAWVLLLHLAIDFMAVAVPAAAAAAANLAAYVAATAGTYMDVYNRFKAQFTVTGATRTDIAPFNYTGPTPRILQQYGVAPTAAGAAAQQGLPTVTRLDELAQVLKPSVFLQLGAALDLLGSKSTVFDKLGIATSQWLDSWTTRIGRAITSGQGFNTFLTVGERDMAQFGHLLGGLGQVFLEFVAGAEKTHIAEDILSGLTLVVHGVVAALGAIGPIGAAAIIALSAFYHYGGVAATAFSNLAGWAVKTAANIGPLNATMVQLAGHMGATNDELVAMTSKSPAIQRISQATGVAANDLATFAVNAEKSGTSIDSLATSTERGAELSARYGAGLDEAGQKAVNFAIAMGATETQLGKVAAGERLAEEDGSKFEGLLASLPSFLTNPVTYVAALVAVLGVLAYHFGTAKTAAQQWIDNLNTGLAQSNPQQGFHAVLGSLTEVNDKLLAADHNLQRLGQGNYFGNLNHQFVVAADNASRLGTSVNQVDTALAKTGGPQGSLGLQFRNVTTDAQGTGTAVAEVGKHFTTMGSDAKESGGVAIGALLGISKQAASTALAQSGLSSASQRMVNAQDSVTHSLYASANAEDAYRARGLAVTQQIMQTQGATKAYASEQTKLSDETNILLYRGGILASTYGVSLNQAFGLATEAGLKFSDMTKEQKGQLALILLQVQELTSGYKAMGVASNQLGSDINVLTYAGSTQLSNIQKLTQAWSTYLGNVSGPQTTFVQLAQQMDAVDTAAKKSGASLDGVNTASLNLRNNFEQAFSLAVNYVNSLTTAGVHTVEPIRHLEAAMIPLARGSQQAESQLVSLAQEANPQITTWQKLTQWVGNTSGSLRTMSKDAGQATIAQRDLAKQSETLSTSLSQDLQNTISNIAYSTSQLPAKLNSWASAIRNVGGSASQTEGDRQQLIKDIMTVTGDTKDQAIAAVNALGQSVLSTDATIAAGHGSRKQLLDDIINFGVPLNTAQQDFNTLAGAIQQTGTKSDATQNARTQLIKDLEHAGVQAKTATTFVDGLIRSLGRIHPVNAKVTIAGEGTWHIQQAGVSGAQPGKRYIPGRAGSAEGGYLGPATGGAKADDKIIAVSGGEYVMNAASVAKYGQGMMDAINAGKFQGGGPVPVTIVSGAEHGTPAQVGQFSDSEYGKTVRAVENDVGNDMRNAIKQAESAAAKMFTGPGGGAASAGGPYNRAMLERLWIGAGGPAGDALVAAAIALAESGGSPGAHNPSSASGLWQILGLPFPGNPFNAEENARMAVAKFRGAGNSFTPWVTFVSGAYRHFLAEGGPVEEALDRGGWLGVTRDRIGQGGFAGGGPIFMGMPGEGMGGRLAHMADGGRLDKHHVGKYTSQHSAYGRAYDQVLSRERDESVAFWRLFNAEPWRLQHAVYQGFIQGNVPKDEQNEARALRRLRQEHGSLLWYTRQLANDPPDRFPAHRWTDWRHELWLMGQDLDRDQSLRRRHPGYYNDLRWREDALHTAVDHLQAEWNKVMHAAPRHLHAPSMIHGLSTHGVVPTLANPSGILPDRVMDLLPDLPHGLAAGGSVASMFGSLAMPAAASVPALGGLPARAYASGGLVGTILDTPRSLSAAGAAGTGERIGLQINGGINITNPAPEPASDSITRSTQKAAFMAGRGVA